jgi:ABC-type branched-subunit amino acid transport system substrate-binding protein
MRKWLNVVVVVALALSLVVGVFGYGIASAKSPKPQDQVKNFMNAAAGLKVTKTAGYWVTEERNNVTSQLNSVPSGTKISLSKLKLVVTSQTTDTAGVTATYSIKIQLKGKSKAQPSNLQDTFTLNMVGGTWLISSSTIWEHLAGLAGLVTPTATATAAPTATPTPTSAGPVKIGVLHDFSGADASSGAFYGVRLIQLVSKEMKDQGGILGGREVNLIKYDGASTVSGILTAAKQAVSKDHVSVICMGGSASVNGEALSKFAEENHTLYVDLFVLPLDISNLKYTIRPGYRLDEMNSMAEYATKVLGAKKVAILARDFEEDHMYGDQWRKIVNAAGGQIVYEQYYALGAGDFTSYLTQIKYKNPDALLTDLLLPDNVTMAIQMNGLGGWGNIKVFCSMAGAFAVGKQGTEVWYIYARWLPGMDNPGSKMFQQDYKAMFGTDPDCIMELMLEPIWWSIKAIELAGTDEPEAVARAARSGNLTWDGPEGPQTMGTDGEVTPKYHLLAQVQNKKLVAVPKWE